MDKDPTLPIPQGIPEPSPESQERVRQYIEEVNSSLENLESLSLTSDKSVKIKIKGQEEVEWKSPKKLFYTGYFRAEPELEQELDLMGENCPGIKYRSHFTESRKLTMADFSTEESVTALKRDLENAYTMAMGSISLDSFGFLGKNLFERDQIIKDIKDKDISEKLRLINFYDVIIRGNSLKQEEVDFFVTTAEQDGTFLRNFLDYSIRNCSTSGHQWSNALFRLFEIRPEWYEVLDQTHKDYSIPFLFERDFYGKTRDAWGKQTEYHKQQEEQCREMLGKFGIDLEKIRERLGALGAKRKYCPELK